MPTQFIRRDGNGYGVASGADGNHAGIGVDKDSDVVVNAGESIGKRVVPKVITVHVPLSSASVDNAIFIADDAYQIVSISEVHSGLGAASSTLDVKKCSGTTAPASGTTVLASAFALDSTANTVVNKTLTSTAADKLLAAGDRLAFDLTGTISSLVGVVSIRLRRVQNG